MKKTSIVALGLSLVLLSQPVLAGGQAPEPSQPTPPAKVQEEKGQEDLLSFSNISAPSQISLSGQIHISFTIKNGGDRPAKDILIAATPTDKKDLVAQSDASIKENTLAPGQEKTYDFLYCLDEGAQAKNYPLELTLSYTDSYDGKKQTQEKTLNLQVKREASDKEGSGKPAPGGLPSLDLAGGSGGSPGPDLTGFGGGGGGGLASGGQEASTGNMPKIIISNYSFQPRIVQAGQNFTLRLDIYNTNKSKTVKNIKVSLSADPGQSMGTQVDAGGLEQMAQGMDMAGAGGSSPAFTPINSSNSFYIESIGPRKTAQKEITFSSMADMAAQTYTLAANFEYEDSQGQTYKSSEIIGIPIVQKAEITAGSIMVEDQVPLGAEVPLSMDFFNTGRSPLSNVMVQVRGNFDTDINTYFVGNFAPGTQDSYNVSITPTEAGKQKGEVVIQYDDATGETQEIIQPFSLNVDEEGALDQEGDMATNGPARPPWALPLALGLIVVLALAIAFYVRKKRKKADDDQDLSL
ncbi:MAG: hypothetical protein Q4E37_02845 [Tissierellia bacterium]|nr:hypothetical protein [Tissierellia bacterium]